MQNPERFFRLADVVEMTAMPRSTLYKAMGQGRFPRPVQIGPRSVRWRESDIIRWQQCVGTSKPETQDKQ